MGKCKYISGIPIFQRNGDRIIRAFNKSVEIFYAYGQLNIKCGNNTFKGRPTKAEDYFGLKDVSQFPEIAQIMVSPTLLITTAEAFVAISKNKVGEKQIRIMVIDIFVADFLEQSDQTLVGNAWIIFKIVIIFAFVCKRDLLHGMFCAFVPGASKCVTTSSVTYLSR